MALQLPREFVDEMIAHAREDAPNECCGIIAGKDGQPTMVFRSINELANPYRYKMDSQDQLRILRECQENEWDFLAFYHSHTASEAYPSPTDIRLAFVPETPKTTGTPMLWWPDAYWVIVSLEDAGNPVVRAFRILSDSQVNEEEIRAD